MLPLRTPTSFREAIEMYGVKSDEERLRSQVMELKRDSLAHFGKFRANVAKRIDSIIIRKGGKEGNVTQPQLRFEAQVNSVGSRQPVFGSGPYNNARGKQQQLQPQPTGANSSLQPQSGGIGATLGKFPFKLLLGLMK
jgi:hypothetical protein